jgi:predicted nucleic acid-binding protein
VTTYVDSGVLVKLYSYEALSKAAVELVAALAQAPLVALHELEVRNALRAQRGRGVITARQLSEALRAFDADIYEHRLVRVQIDWPLLFQASEVLSRQFTPSLFCRSLDILHVAAARQIGCEELVTGDARQARLAESAGLQAVNISGGSL